MSDPLKARLARALEVGPDEILTFRAADSGYTVILNSYKKFTRVRPYEEAQPWQESKAYLRPAAARKAQLAELCRLLSLDFHAKATRKELIAAIEAFKAGPAEGDNAEEHTK